MPKYNNKDMMNQIADLLKRHTAANSFKTLSLQLLNLLGYESNKTIAPGSFQRVLQLGKKVQAEI